jgi:hypothetical protein
MSTEAPEAPAAPSTQRHIRCGTCRRRFPCTPEDLLRYARDGWPKCCAEVMVLDPGIDEAAPRNNRLGRRRAAKAGGVAELRLGALGLGPDLGAGLVDVSDDGACVRVKAAVAQGAQVELKLAGPGRGKPVAIRATVCWCRPEGGRFLVGVRLARRLTHSEMSELAR